MFNRLLVTYCHSLTQPQQGLGVTTKNNFLWRQWGSSLPGLRMLEPPLSPPSTPVDIFRRTSLGGGTKVEGIQGGGAAVD